MKRIKIIASIVVMVLFYVAAVSSGSSKSTTYEKATMRSLTSGDHSVYDSASGKD